MLSLVKQSRVEKRWRAEEIVVSKREAEDALGLALHTRWSRSSFSESSLWTPPAGRLSSPGPRCSRRNPGVTQMHIPFNNVVEQPTEQRFQKSRIKFSIYSSLLVQQSSLNQRGDTGVTEGIHSARTYCKSSK